MQCCWTATGTVQRELLNGSSPGPGLAPAATAAAAEKPDGTVLLEKQQPQRDKAFIGSDLAIEIMTGSSNSSRSGVCNSTQMTMPDLADFGASLDHDLESASLGGDPSDLCHNPDLVLAEILHNDSWDAKIWDQQVLVQGSELTMADSGYLGPSSQQQGILCSSSNSSDGDLARQIRPPPVITPAGVTETLDVINKSVSPAQASGSSDHIPDHLHQHSQLNSSAGCSSNWDHGMLPSCASTTSSPQQQQHSTGNAGSSSDRCQPCRVAAAVAAAAAPSYTPRQLGCPDHVALEADGSSLVPQQQQQQQQWRPYVEGLEPQQQQQQPDRPWGDYGVLQHPRVQQAAQQYQRQQSAVRLLGPITVVGASGRCIGVEMPRPLGSSSEHLRQLQIQRQQQQELQCQQQQHLHQQQQQQQFLPADPLGLLPLPDHDVNGDSWSSSPSTSVLLTNGLTLEAYVQAHARLQRQIQAAYQAGHLAGTWHCLQQHHQQQQQQQRQAVDQQASQQPGQQRQRQRKTFVLGACKRPRSRDAGPLSKKVAVSTVPKSSWAAAAAAAAPGRTAQSGSQVRPFQAPSRHRGVLACKETAFFDPAAAAASGPPAVIAATPVLSELLASDCKSAAAWLRHMSDSELLLLAAQAIKTRPPMPTRAAVAAAPAAAPDLAAQAISPKPVTSFL